MLDKITKAISLVIDDVLLLVGIGFLSYGAYAIYVPAGHITLGLCTIGFAYLMAKREGGQ